MVNSASIMKKEKVFISILFWLLICFSYSEGKDSLYFEFACSARSRSFFWRNSLLFWHQRNQEVFGLTDKEIMICWEIENKKHLDKKQKK